MLAIPDIVDIYMLFSGWGVRIMKNCDRVLKMLPEAI